jgi:Flp pilus assembly pilin Flp
MDTGWVMLLGFFREEDGATAVEYALVASVFVLMATMAWTMVGNAVAEMYNHTADTITSSTGS